MYSRIGSHSLKTTLHKTVLLNAQPLVILRRVWKMAMSAVCGLLLWSVYDVAYENPTHIGCGDVADITNNGGTTAAETDCSTACSGDPSHLCGGAWKLQLYLWHGILYNWHTPTVTGRYEVRTNPPFLYTRVLQSYLAQYLVPGLVPPLISTVGINGKVSFIEKYGTSEFKNSTGAYELDLSLVDDFEHAWREMHVKMDPWCSAAIVLPDKAARILNIGGWTETSTVAIRLYTPDGSAGVNGTNDWEEHPSALELQVRWYIRPYTMCTVLVLNEIACRVDVGIQPHWLCPMEVSSLWVAQTALAGHPTQRLRFSLGLPVGARWSSLTGSPRQTRIISTHSFMSFLAVAYLLVSL